MIAIPKSVESTNEMIFEILRAIGMLNAAHYELISSEAEPTQQTNPNDIVVQLAYTSNYQLREMAAHISKQVGIENNTTEGEDQRHLIVREKVHFS
jgi:hypothetical protein